MYYCNALECPSHISKTKKLHMYPFMAEVMWVTWPRDLPAQRRWKPLVQRVRKDNRGKNVNVLILTRKSRLRSCYFNKEKISTADYTSGDPVCFVWNNRKPLEQGRPERRRSADPWLSSCSAPLNAMFHGTTHPLFQFLFHLKQYLIHFRKCHLAWPKPIRHPGC